MTIGIAALILATIGVLLLVAAIFILKKRRYIASFAGVCLAVTLFSMAGLLITVSAATKGYRALTKEEVAAVVTIEPTAPQKFNALFRFPDGREARFGLAGDQFYVDARILKWKPIVNILGLHTAYELDRIAGRYCLLEDETTKPRTVYNLLTDKPLDMYVLRQKHAFLKPLLDVEYGSATFTTASAGTYEVRVSTTGLLVRPVER